VNVLERIGIKQNQISDLSRCYGAVFVRCIHEHGGITGGHLQRAKRGNARLDQKCKLIVQAESGKTENISDICTGEHVHSGAE